MFSNVRIKKLAPKLRWPPTRVSIGFFLNLSIKPFLKNLYYFFIVITVDIRQSQSFFKRLGRLHRTLQKEKDQGLDVNIDLNTGSPAEHSSFLQLRQGPTYPNERDALEFHSSSHSVMFCGLNCLLSQSTVISSSSSENEDKRNECNESRRDENSDGEGNRENSDMDVDMLSPAPAPAIVAVMSKDILCPIESDEASRPGTHSINYTCTRTRNDIDADENVSPPKRLRLNANQQQSFHPVDTNEANIDTTSQLRQELIAPTSRLLSIISNSAPAFSSHSQANSSQISGSLHRTSNPIVSSPSIAPHSFSSPQASLDLFASHNLPNLIPMVPPVTQSNEPIGSNVYSDSLQIPSLNQINQISNQSNHFEQLSSSASLSSCSKHSIDQAQSFSISDSAAISASLSVEALTALPPPPLPPDSVQTPPSSHGSTPDNREDNRSKDTKLGNEVKSVLNTPLRNVEASNSAVASSSSSSSASVGAANNFSSLSHSPQTSPTIVRPEFPPIDVASIVVGVPDSKSVALQAKPESIESSLSTHDHAHALIVTHSSRYRIGQNSTPCNDSWSSSGYCFNGGGHDNGNVSGEQSESIRSRDSSPCGPQDSHRLNQKSNAGTDASLVLSFAASKPACPYPIQSTNHGSLLGQAQIYPTAAVRTKAATLTLAPESCPSVSNLAIMYNLNMNDSDAGHSVDNFECGPPENRVLSIRIGIENEPDSLNGEEEIWNVSENVEVAGHQQAGGVADENSDDDDADNGSDVVEGSDEEHVDDKLRTVEKDQSGFEENKAPAMNMPPIVQTDTSFTDVQRINQPPDRNGIDLPLQLDSSEVSNRFSRESELETRELLPVTKCSPSDSEGDHDPQESGCASPEIGVSPQNLRCKLEQSDDDEEEEEASNVSPRMMKADNDAGHEDVSASEHQSIPQQNTVANIDDIRRIKTLLLASGGMTTTDMFSSIAASASLTTSTRSRGTASLSFSLGNGYADGVSPSECKRSRVFLCACRNLGYCKYH
jgi:hypothetical protein